MTSEEQALTKLAAAIDSYHLEALARDLEYVKKHLPVEKIQKTGMGPFKAPIPSPHPNENSFIGYVDRKYKGISPTDKKAIHKKYLSDKGPQCPGCLVYTWEHHHDKACALSASRTA